MWARNFFNNIRNNLDLDKFKSQILKLSQTRAAAAVATTVLTASVTHAFDQFGKDKKLESAQARIDSLQLRSERTDGQEQMLKNRIDSLGDELRNTDRKKVELHMQLLEAQNNLKISNRDKEVYKSAYEQTWLCLHKPPVIKAVNDNAFPASISINKINS